MVAGTSLALAALASEEHTLACFVKPLVEPSAGNLASAALAFGTPGRIVGQAALDTFVATAQPVAAAWVAATLQQGQSSGAPGHAPKVLDR
jgi:hypothetical protein